MGRVDKIGTIEVARDATIRTLDEDMLMRACLTFTLRTSIDDILPIVEPGDFFDPVKGEVWRLVGKLRERNSYPTIENLRGEYSRGSEYPEDRVARILREADGNPVRKGEAKRAAELIRESALRRRLLHAVESGVQRVALGGELGVYQDALDVIYGHLGKLSADTSVLEGVSLSEAVESWWTRLETVDNRRSVPTPWWELSEKIPRNGWCGGQLVTFAARPGVGKSVALLQSAYEASRDQIPTLLVTLEMSEAQTMDRLIACGADVKLTRLKNHTPQTPLVTDDDRRKIAEWQDRHQADPLTIVMKPRASVADIRHHAKAVQRSGGLGLIVIDYLQIMAPPKNIRERHLAIGENTAALKQLALELDVPIITAAQLNRSVDGKPGLTHLRESGSIEQDSDIVIMIDRDANDPACYECDLIVAKNRDGQVGTVEHLRWDGWHSRIGMPN